MFFNLSNELILRDGQVDPKLFQFVQGAEKEHMARKVVGQLNADLTKNAQFIVHSNMDVNTVEEALNKCPMYINAIQNRGYRHILFVGHFNNDQAYWVLDKFADRTVDVFPPERSHMQTMVDPNIMLQFIPMIYKMMGYKSQIAVASPPATRNRGVMHSLYKQNGLGKSLTPVTAQYRHGMGAGEWSLVDEQVAPFDAVVFLGVPKHSESFTEEQVRAVFAPYCTEDFEMIDLYYNQGDSSKWIDGTKKDATPDLDLAFTVRAKWDPSVKDAGGRPEELLIMQRTFNVY